MNAPPRLQPMPRIKPELRDGYEFAVDFDLRGVPPLGTDSPPPLGKGGGPDSEMLLMAAVGNCLSASLAFALRKFKNDDVPMRTEVSGELARNEAGRLRVSSIAVEIRLGAAMSRLRLGQRAIDQFEDFCTMTQSVRRANPVSVNVFDRDGRALTPTSPG